MIYILDQRLRAQKIDPDKQERVLTDVIRYIFNAEDEFSLFTPQITMAAQNLFKFLESAILCSIMKLNEQSMRKLLDLTLMGVKLQVYNSQSPCEVFYVTLNHLNGILEIAKIT